MSPLCWVTRSSRKSIISMCLDASIILLLIFSFDNSLLRSPYIQLWCYLYLSNIFSVKHPYSPYTPPRQIYVSEITLCPSLMLRVALILSVKCLNNVLLWVVNPYSCNTFYFVTKWVSCASINTNNNLIQTNLCAVQTFQIYFNCIILYHIRPYLRTHASIYISIVGIACGDFSHPSSPIEWFWTS